MKEVGPVDLESRIDLTWHNRVNFLKAALAPGKFAILKQDRCFIALKVSRTDSGLIPTDPLAKGEAK